jgi:hypothetical protein
VASAAILVYIHSPPPAPLLCFPPPFPPWSKSSGPPNEPNPLKKGRDHQPRLSAAHNPAHRVAVAVEHLRRGPPHVHELQLGVEVSPRDRVLRRRVEAQLLQAVVLPVHRDDGPPQSLHLERVPVERLAAGQRAVAPARPQAQRAGAVQLPCERWEVRGDDARLDVDGRLQSAVGAEREFRAEVAPVCGAVWTLPISP